MPSNSLEELQEEIFSINSIYGDGTLYTESPVVTKGYDAFSICVLSPPTSTIEPQIILKLLFPITYPVECPTIIDATTNGKGVSSDRAAKIAKNTLEQVWLEGNVVVFDLVEALKIALDDEPQDPPIVPQGTNIATIELSSLTEDQEEAQSVRDPSPPSYAALTIPIPWTITPPTTVQKSVFIARAVSISSVSQAKSYLQTLISTDKKVAKATHNITAYRICTPEGLSYQDNDDDGETAAGSRLAHLLELVGVENVMVVVSRWYGGIHLGPDRFRLINQVARESLVMGGFVDEGGKGKEGKGKKGLKK